MDSSRPFQRGVQGSGQDPWDPAPRDRGSGAGRTDAIRALEALDCLRQARTAVDQMQYDVAMERYTYMVQEFPDLALSAYARVGRAMLLYQIGRTSDAILALEAEASALVGSAEIHAALAALLYSERPNLVFRAEQEWEIACSFDRRYSDLAFVRDNKHWPERMITALSRFLTMQA